MTIDSLVDDIRARRISPAQVIEDCLRSLERWQPATNAVLALRADEALEEATQLPLNPVGPLHGVPVLVKDVFDVAGQPTTGASRALDPRPKPKDSPLVRELRRAGAIVVGKTNLHELATGGTGHVSAFGPARNPWDPDRMTGGSSSGSAAAVATGAVPLALGSDTGGSIRIPGSFCGVTGLKPTHGLLSTAGMLPLAPSYDCPGPLAASAADITRAMTAFDRFAALEPSPTPSRIGIAGAGLYAERLHPDVTAALAEAGTVFEAMGLSVVEVDLDGLDESPVHWSQTAWPEFVECFPDLDLDRTDEWVRRVYQRGRQESERDRSAGRAGAINARTVFERALALVDVLLLPVTPYPAPRFDETDVQVAGGTMDVYQGGPAWLTRPINLTGLPALALPAGRSTSGLPLGLQLVGRHFEDRALLALGEAFQRVTDHHLDRPPPPPAE
jgi:aspartyl-tRNA(Asn)/glutamyl-tRNA(Gln) amidotransferase subunit A